MGNTSWRLHSVYDAMFWFWITEEDWNTAANVQFNMMWSVWIYQHIEMEAKRDTATYWMEIDMST